ncbi:MAG: polysaccharide biosynthesis protein [Pseudomonadota bacterium]
MNTSTRIDGPVLITGGTGSFGKTMTQYLLDNGVSEIRVLSRDEAKQEDMRLSYERNEIKFYIGDVRDKQSVAKAMRGVSLVFHAAALKQVPSCEFFPLEAVKTNIIGSQNVIESAAESGVRSVVCLSTDKAVMPVNAMGMSKALMEKVAQAESRKLGRNDTVVSCVRYGNVMYSRGSVIPLFIKQIQSGKALTITEPSMTRFMLSLPDAIELVRFAFDHATQGDIFVKKAPACTVQQLAETLLRLFGAENPIRQIGMRHGEKLYETLASAEELRRSEDMGAYYRVRYDDRDLNYNKYFSEGDLEEVAVEGYHSHNTEQLTDDELDALLLALPEVQQALGKSI